MYLVCLFLSYSVLYSCGNLSGDSILRFYIKGKVINLQAPFSMNDYDALENGELPVEKLQLEWVYLCLITSVCYVSRSLSLCIYIISERSITPQQV